MLALQRARQEAESAGDSDREEAWAQQLQHLDEQRQRMADACVQAYKRLKQELASLHKSMSVYWKSQAPIVTQ